MPPTRSESLYSLEGCELEAAINKAVNENSDPVLMDQGGAEDFWQMTTVEEYMDYSHDENRPTESSKT